MSDVLVFVGFIAFLAVFVYLLIALVGWIRKNGKAKKALKISGLLFVSSFVLMGIGTAISPKKEVSNIPASVVSAAPKASSPQVTLNPIPSPSVAASISPEVVTSSPISSATTPFSSPSPMATIKPVSSATSSIAPTPTPSIAAVETKKQEDVYYKNCSDAKSKGVTNIRKGDPGYRKDLDKDGDGVACEK